MLRLPCECYECLRMLTNGLANVTNVIMNDANVTYQHCHCLDIFLRMMRIVDDDAAIGVIYKYRVNMTLGSLFSWIWKEKQQWLNIRKEGETANVTNALQMPYERCKCFRMPYQRYQWLAKIDGEWQHSQHSLKFRRRFLNWSIFVSRWRITCECFEFVTNAYKYSSNFEKMSNIFIRKHIRKHICRCVRATVETIIIHENISNIYLCLEFTKNTKRNIEWIIIMRDHIKTFTWTTRITQYCPSQHLKVHTLNERMMQKRSEILTHGVIMIRWDA